MANEQNLIPYEPGRSKEEAKIAGRKGGIASGKARRERRTMAEILKILMDMPLTDQQVDKLAKSKNFANLRGKNVTVEEAMLIAQTQKALKGDLKSAQFIRDTIGEQPVPPTQQLEVVGGGLPVQIINDVPDDEEEKT